MSDNLCPVAGNTVITDEKQVFANTSIRTEGTCVELSCYTDFYVDGPEKACCLKVDNVLKWVPGAGTCKLNETANEINFVASNIQMSEVVCYSVIGVLAGLVAVGLFMFLTALCCCFMRRRRKNEMRETVVHHEIVREYVPQSSHRAYHNNGLHEERQYASQPPSYASGRSKPWPSGGTEYPMYREQPHRREVDDYDRGRRDEDGKPNLWLTYADSLEGRGQRNSGYERDHYDDRDAELRNNYSRRW